MFGPCLNSKIRFFLIEEIPSFFFQKDLVVVLLNFLETALGPEHFDEPVKSSWVKALDVVVNVVSTGLPEPSPDAQESTSENSSIDP